MSVPDTSALESESQVVASRWATTKPVKVGEAKVKAQPVPSPKEEQKKETPPTPTP